MLSPIGDRAKESALRSPLPDRIRDVVRNAPRCGEGTGFRLEVRSEEDLDALRLLARAKMET